jgi:hypothetical protein
MDSITDYTELKTVFFAAMVEYKYKELTGGIINAALTVHNTLGYGFLEKVYHKSFV